MAVPRHALTGWVRRHAKLLSLIVVVAEISGGFYATNLTLTRVQHTQDKLCGAALALAGFWEQVRASTRHELADRFLVASARRADTEFVQELTVAIGKARAVGDC